MAFLIGYVLGVASSVAVYVYRAKLSALIKSFPPKPPGQ